MFPQGWLATDGVGCLFVLLCVGALLALGFGRPLRRPASDAERILKSRYAQGEMTRHEYEQRLDELRR